MFAELDIRLLSANKRAVEKLARSTNADLIIAHTTPFFEILPSLAGGFARWAWEHGDPTSALFPGEMGERQAIADNKVRSVYTNVDRVIAISEFIRSDIGFSDAIVIPNGCDHVPCVLPKGDNDFPGNMDGVLKIGTLMRLGAKERNYKGNDLFIELVRLISNRVLKAEFHVMGRGSDDDAMPFREQGITVHLNATEDEKFAYLRSLDVFVSLSLWEGFNLPLVEAQALGTVGLAFDTGAHPEVTPFIVSSLHEMVELVGAYADNSSLLAKHSSVAFHFVRQNFCWARTTERLIEQA
jgi:glycosyltransferase involved in cell wall biosynthesis